MNMEPVQRQEKRRGVAHWVGKKLDAAVLAVSPVRGHRRIKARVQAAKLAAVYEGAGKGRFHGSWPQSGGSADQDLIFSANLSTLRERSRELVRNDPLATSVMRVIEDNVIGCGIRPQARATAEETGLTEPQVKAWNKARDAVFAHWAENEADATGQTDFAGLQRLMLRGLNQDGESFVHPIMVSGEVGRTFSTAIELVEPERVASPAGSSDLIREGVEVGSRGQAIAYHVRKGHPGDQFSNARAEDFTRIRRFRDGRRNMIHLFRRKRPGQTRGAPALAPALSTFDHLRASMKYELVAQRVNSSIALFIKRSGGGDEAAIDWDADEEKYLEGIEAGGIEYLGDGEEIDSFNPNRPGNTWDPFIIRNLRSIGAAVGLPYELFARDASKVNYTSSRTLLLEAWRGFRCTQALITCSALQPVLEIVMIEAYARGELPTVEGFGDLRIRKALLRTAWIPPARGWVDPTKEIQAAREAVTAGLSTRSDENAGNGRDFEETSRIRARELRFLLDLEKENNLPAGSLSGAEAPPITPPVEEEDVEEEDVEEEEDEEEEDQVEDQVEDELEEASTR